MYKQAQGRSRQRKIWYRIGHPSPWTPAQSKSFTQLFWFMLSLLALHHQVCVVINVVKNTLPCKIRENFISLRKWPGHVRFLGGSRQQLLLAITMVHIYKSFGFVCTIDVVSSENSFFIPTNKPHPPKPHGVSLWSHLPPTPGNHNLFSIFIVCLNWKLLKWKCFMCNLFRCNAFMTQVVECINISFLVLLSNVSS